MWREIEKVCVWKHPSDRVLLQYERASPAVLTFLRETGVARMLNLAPPEGEGGGEEEQNEREEMEVIELLPWTGRGGELGLVERKEARPGPS